MDTGYEAWIWVGGLGLVKFAEAIAQSFLYWQCFMGLNIPIRSQLSAVIFRKTLLKKDVKGSQKTEGEQVDGKAGTQTDIVKKLDAGEDEDELKNLKQGTINLLAIDASRIADLAGFSNIFAESAFGIIMYVQCYCPL